MTIAKRLMGDSLYLLYTGLPCEAFLSTTALDWWRMNVSTAGVLSALWGEILVLAYLYIVATLTDLLRIVLNRAC